MLDQIPEARGLPRLRVFRELLYAQYHRIVAHLPVDGVKDLGEPVILASLLRCQHIEDVQLDGFATADATDDDSCPFVLIAFLIARPERSECRFSHLCQGLLYRYLKSNLL